MAAASVPFKGNEDYRQSAVLKPAYCHMTPQLGRYDDGIQEEIDRQVGEVQAVLVDVGEALGFVPRDQHGQIACTI